LQTTHTCTEDYEVLLGPSTHPGVGGIVCCAESPYDTTRDLSCSPRSLEEHNSQLHLPPWFSPSAHQSSAVRARKLPGLQHSRARCCTERNNHGRRAEQWFGWKERKSNGRQEEDGGEPAERLQQISTGLGESCCPLFDPTGLRLDL